MNDDALRHSQEMAQRRRKERRSSPFWYATSITLHLVAFGLLVWFTPLREVVKDALPERKPKPKQTAESLSRLSDIIQNTQTMTMQIEVSSIDRARQELENIREAFASNYVTYAEDMAPTVQDEIQKMLADALAQNEELVNSMKQLNKEAVLLKKTPTDDLDALAAKSDEVTAKQSETLKKQDAINQALDKVLQLAQLSGMTNTSAMVTNSVAKQDKAWDQEETAKQVVQTSVSKRRANVDLQRRITETYRSITNNMKNVEATIESQKKLAERQVSTRAEKTKQELMNAADEQRKQEIAEDLKTATEADKKRLENSIRDIEKRQKQRDQQIANIVKQMEQTEKSIASETARHEKSTKELFRQEGVLRERQETQRQNNQEANQARERIEYAQADATRLQAELTSQIKNIAAAAKKERQSIDAVAQALVQVRQPPVVVRKKDAVELYDTARKLEEQAVETYRDIRALERAMLSKMSVETAKRLTDVAKPDRKDMNAQALRSKVRTQEALDAYKEAITETVRETIGINVAVQALLENAAQTEKTHSEGFSVALITQRAEELRKEREDAAEDESNIAKDLTQPQQQQTQVPMPGAKGGPPPLAKDMPDQVFGRTLSATGVPGSWMAINSWYVIGPFPNPQRINIDRAFPPETVRDLDAVYIGKDGQPIRWQFYQSPRAEIRPDFSQVPYSIWYGYTEIRSDVACDVWLAMGSDDKSKIWLNGAIIWESVPQHKHWNIGEGFRKVSLRAGTNTILYRIENGHHGMAWSLVMCLDKTR